MSHIAQVGGTHYEARDGVQHWDVMERYDIAYLEATSTKYIVRWDRKGTPVLDLEKSISYLERLLQDREQVRRTVPGYRLDGFFTANKLDDTKRNIIALILCDGHGRRKHLRSAISQLRQLLAEQRDLKEKLK